MPCFPGWLTLRKTLHSGLVLVDLEKKNLPSILDAVTAKLTEKKIVGQEQAVKLKELWLRKHRHQFEGPRKAEGNFSRVIEDLLVQKLESKAVK